MKVSPEQTLSDIRVILQYIKEHLSLEKQSSRGEQLDHMGQTTLKILTALSSVDTSMGETYQGIFTTYTDKIDNISQDLKSSLSLVSHEIKENIISNEDLQIKIAGAYDKYVQDSIAITQALSDQHVLNKGQYESITNTLDDLAISIDGINEKIVSAEMLEEVFATLYDKLDGMAEADQSFDKASKSALGVIGGQLNTATELLENISGSLGSIEASFTESTSRLSLVDVKADAILKIVTEDAHNE